MSKRSKASKLFILTTAAAVTGIPIAADNPIQAQASSNASQLVTKAEKLAGALKWQVSYEYRKTAYPSNSVGYPNMTLFNQTKAALAAAEKAVKATKGTERTALESRLNQNVKVYLDRAVKYIDAISSGKKILDKAVVLYNKVKVDIIDDSTVAAYHAMSNEIKKRSPIISRVYGKTTRDALFAAYVNSTNSVKTYSLYPVSIKMEINSLNAAIQTKNKDKILYCIGRINKYFTDGVNLKLLDSNGAMYKQLDAEYKNALKSAEAIIGTPAQAVAAAKAKLTFSLIANGNSAADNVTGNLTLPTADVGVTITWSSDKPSIVTNTGVIYRSPSTDTDVVLTAVIKSIETPSVSETVTIPVKVKRQLQAAPILQGVSGITGGSAVGTTKIGTLPALPSGAVRFEYKISTTNNAVPTPAVGDVFAGKTFTAGTDIAVENGKHIGIAAVDANGLVVQFVDVIAVSAPAVTPAEKVAVAKAKLTFSAIANGNTAADNVTKNLTLPTTDTGVTITWSSDKPLVVTNTGEVHPSPLNDEKVVLAAVIKSTENTAVSDTVTIQITVKQQQQQQAPILGGVGDLLGGLLGGLLLPTLPALPAGAAHYEYILSDNAIPVPYVGDVFSGLPYTAGLSILGALGKHLGIAAVDATGKVVQFIDIPVPSILPIL